MSAALKSINDQPSKLKNRELWKEVCGHGALVFLCVESLVVAIGKLKEDVSKGTALILFAVVATVLASVQAGLVRSQQRVPP